MEVPKTCGKIALTTGKHRKSACTTAAGRENERAQRARDGLTRDHGHTTDLPGDHQTTANARDLPLPRDYQTTGNARDLPRDQQTTANARDSFFSAGPPDHGKRARFTIGPPDKRSNLGGTRWHQLLFLTPLSVFSLGRFWARGEPYRRGVTRNLVSRYQGIKDTWRK